MARICTNGTQVLERLRREQLQGRAARRQALVVDDGAGVMAAIAGSTDALLSPPLLHESAIHADRAARWRGVHVTAATADRCQGAVGPAVLGWHAARDGAV